MITLEELKEILEIDSTSPSGLRWKVSVANRLKVGDVAGSPNGTGYFRVSINNIRYVNHRIIYALYHNLELNQLPKVLDHIDRNKANNNPLNLRPATNSQNSANSSTYKNNTSGFKGVYWYKKGKVWRSEVMVNGKALYLGQFNTIEEAIEAHKETSIKYFGEFSCVHRPL